MPLLDTSAHDARRAHARAEAWRSRGARPPAAALRREPAYASVRPARRVSRCRQRKPPHVHLASWPPSPARGSRDGGAARGRRREGTGGARGGVEGMGVAAGEAA
jgi:hypothetical protein